MSNIVGWLLTFFFLISLLAIIAYQLTCFADLECDYINPYDSAKQINMVVLPEFVVQAILCIAYLATGLWFFCLLSLPYLYFNVRLYAMRQHLVDVTEIYNQMHWEKKQRIFKLGYLIILMVLSIFWLLWTAAVRD